MINALWLLLIIPAFVALGWILGTFCMVKYWEKDTIPLRSFDDIDRKVDENTSWLSAIENIVMQ